MACVPVAFTVQGKRRIFKNIAKIVFFGICTYIKVQLPWVWATKGHTL
jgi:hypothetical protein